jgi:hypothetical protein
LIGTYFTPVLLSKNISSMDEQRGRMINGQILFPPLYGTKTYLIETTGAINHTWSSSYTPGAAVYWLGDGTIMRTIRTVVGGGGSGGGVQKVQWDGTVEWDFRYSSGGKLSHHDIKPLPNGNVLMIAWETKTRNEAIAAGRNPATVTSQGLLPDHIIEVEPTGPTSGAIVWEWHAWSHLIQDYDSSKQNYGVVGDHPELIDINFGTFFMSNDDWLHTNSIDYNVSFDQIILSVHNFNEIWVIDHSTTTEEAAGHTGGNYGHGGDLLYRWGNPQAYRRGTSSDQILFGQHSTSWIKSGFPGAGHILIFNNGVNRPGGQYSSIDEIIPPVDANGSYYLTPGSTYGPENLTWSYTANPPTSFYAYYCSGAERLKDGDTLICDGVAGRFFEVTPDKTTVWSWINPYPSPSMNDVFKINYIPPAQQSPSFGIPTPTNGSTNNPLSLTWSIPISDPNSDLFSWTIQCSNGQTNSGTIATNGNKTLTLSGLVYLTTYKIWVNATDPDGSGQYTRKWYTFTTKADQPPVFGSPNPANGSINNPLSFTWSIPIDDPEGDQFSWTIQCSNGQTNSGSGASNGTKSLDLSGLAYLTTYKVWVNATDPDGSGHYTRRWYTFTTGDKNQPPFFGVPTPTNGSTNQPLNLTWSIPINDPNGDIFSWIIQCSNGQMINGASASNGTKSLALSGLGPSKTYKVWVNATDPTGSDLYTRRWYIFTTRANQPPNTPTITGPAQGKIKMITDYNFTTTDPNSDEVYFFIDWGDQTNSSWLGPSSSGNIVTQSHTWTKKGTYTINAKAKDVYGDESGWGTLQVTMPRSYNIPFQLFWERLFERFPHAFPILRHMMGY